MKKITSILIFMLLTTVSSMASTPIDLTVHTFSSWGDGCTVSGTTITYTVAWKGAGCWLATSETEGMNLTADDYLWVVLNSSTCAFTLDVQYFGATAGKIDETLDSKIESGKAGDLIIGAALNATAKNNTAQFYLQNHDVGVLDVKAAYVGTKAEYDAAVAGNKQQKIDLTLTDLGAGWSSTYANPTITYTAEWAGRGWWLSGIDYTDFDQAVVNFAKPTPMSGNFIVEYKEIDPTTNKNYFTSVPFEAGATTASATFDTTHKNAVNQIYIQASTTGDITLASAFVATNAYIASGINSATSDNSNAEIISTNYYDAAGQQTNGLQQGLNIVSKKLSNGKIISSKVLVK